MKWSIYILCHLFLIIVVSVSLLCMTGTLESLNAGSVPHSHFRRIEFGSHRSTSPFAGDTMCVVRPNFRSLKLQIGDRLCPVMEGDREWRRREIRETNKPQLLHTLETLNTCSEGSTIMGTASLCTHPPAYVYIAAYLITCMTTWLPRPPINSL